ncbi:PDZ domain-containing protein [uncultured Rubinisphaera sp.]|uniref:PDZ domain-containing protein n=1 Tax=uncultured Rubinisphaera sp. TaxID=1678686 RepID=UPI0030D99BD5
MTCLLPSAFLFAILFSGSIATAEFPPAPALQELTSEFRQQALNKLDADDYRMRTEAQQILEQGGLETAQALPKYVSTASIEGKVRAEKVLEQITLKLVQTQADEQIEKIQQVTQDFRQADFDLFGPRLDEFQTTYSTLLERASVRRLIRLNAVINFAKANKPIDGISNNIFAIDLPETIFIGDDFTGQEKDLHHFSSILRSSELLLGNGRGIYHIGDCPIPLERLRDLAAGVPGVAVEHRSSAKMGISGSINEPDWKIQSVQPGTSAKYAGLQVNDTIVRLDGNLVGNFRSFTVDLEPYQPGDRLTLDIQRDSTKPKIVELELDEKKQFGIEIDADFKRFVLIKSVAKDSAAERAGLSSMYRIDRVNGLPLFRPEDYAHLMTLIQDEETIKLTVRPLEAVEVQMRGWVGPYR